jgi:hypothetical protein
MPQAKSMTALGKVALSAIAGIAILSLPTAAFAATGGSGSPESPVVNVQGTPGGQSVLCTIPVPAAGGTIGCSGIAVTLGTGLDGLELVLSSGPAPSPAVTPAITIGFYHISTGLKFSGSFTPPVSVTYTNSAVTAGERVLVYVASTGTWVSPPSGLISSASTSAGKVTLTVTGDPTFYVPGSAIAGATVPVTGKPFLGEGLVAIALVMGGLSVLMMVMRRRPLRRA